MTTEQREPLYASTAKPWLKYYDQKYIDHASAQVQLH